VKELLEAKIEEALQQQLQRKKKKFWPGKKLM